jgi:sugar-specific transcriptional regulator TrmB
MNLSILERIGLTKDQSETYALLLQQGSLTPLELMKISGQNRTNAYMSLSKIESLGLAKRDEEAKKLTYIAVSPTQLENIIDSHAKRIQEARAEFDSQLPNMLESYYSSSKRPAIKFYEGKESLYKVYEDHLKTNEDVYFVRTPADEEHFGQRLYDYMDERAKHGITAHGVIPYTKERFDYAKKNDEKLRRKITWCSPEQYTSEVEISIYGNKTAFISFGDETTATIFDSKQIAKAMKQLFKMAQQGSKGKLN